MDAVTNAWPQKTREFHNHHFDSTIWNDFAFRNDDVVIATYGKSGTTWTQQIIGQLIFGGSAEISVAELSPWLDLRVPPKAVKLAAMEAQTHRRFIKTHLPVDALVFSPKARYVFVGRDGRDVIWSMYNHHARANADWYAKLNETPGRVGPPIEPPPASTRRYFLEWLEQDGHPFWPFFSHVRSWWAVRDLPNVLMVHFADLKADMPGEIARIAAFLGIEADPASWPTILQHCSFDYMKAHAAQSAPLGGAFWDGGAETFIHRGTNGRWHDELTAEDVAAYEAKVAAELPADCAAWLAEGRLAGNAASIAA